MGRKGLFRSSGLAHGISILWLAILALGFGNVVPESVLAQKAPPPDFGKKITVPEGPVDYRGCVELALRQSPYLVNTRVEIDLKQIDEKDSKWSFIPTLSMHSGYYFSTPAGQSPYSLQFYSDPYNPFETYFTLQARKVITKMTFLAHQQSISEFIFHLGEHFLDLDSQMRVEAIQKESVALAEQNVAFTASRLKSGTGTKTEAHLAEQEAELAAMELDRISADIATLRDTIKSLLGVAPEQRLEFSLQDVKKQVIDDFNPSTVTYSEVLASSFLMQVQTMKRELQSKNITLARMKYMPVFNLGIENANPLSGVNNNNAVYVTAGVTMPIWDNLTRMRNVTRQKLILQQYEAEGDVKSRELNTRWEASLAKLRAAALQLKVAEGQLEVASTKERQAEIGYREGRQPFSAMISEQRSVLDTRKSVEARKTAYDKAVLEIRYYSGDLFRNYVQVMPF